MNQVLIWLAQCLPSPFLSSCDLDMMPIYQLKKVTTSKGNNEFFKTSP